MDITGEYLDILNECKKEHPQWDWSAWEVRKSKKLEVKYKSNPISTIKIKRGEKKIKSWDLSDCPSRPKREANYFWQKLEKAIFGKNFPLGPKGDPWPF